PKYSLINLEPILSYKYYGLSEAFRAITEEEKDLEKFKTSFYAKNLIKTYEFFQEKISDTPIETLEKMFDALTKKMLFSAVELNDNRIDPFSSFETINNRGKDLSTLELFKNRLHFVAHKICNGQKLETLQQEINKTYTIIYDDLRSFEDDDLERFLKHFVAYYYGENSNKFKERLLEMEFNAHRKYDDANLDDEYDKIDELLSYLSYSSKIWNFLHTLDEKAITLKEFKIEITPKTRTLLDKMRRLNALSDNAFLPLLLSLFTIQLEGKHANKQPYTTKELEGLLEYLERFGFLIYGVAGKNTAKNEWIELAFKAFRSYREGEGNITIEDLPTLEKSFFNRQGNSALELLEETIHSKKNTEKWYQWGKVLNYLLYEYELYHNPETTLNFDDSIESIEHILPQKPDQGYSAKEKNWAKNPHIAHALGNLLLIPKNANSSLSNKPFEEKRKAYLGSYSEKEVAKNASFGVAQIKERSEKLLDFLIARYRIAELVGEDAIKDFKNALLKDIK
ncbi:HNH endonuclease family protein, partial [Helicobacter pylori]